MSSIITNVTVGLHIVIFDKKPQERKRVPYLPKNMVCYILNYFPLAVRGETARFLFHVADVEFTDNRITIDEWGKVKDDAKRFPLAQMPTLEVDNQVCFII